jgi:TetR/AcrR family transcriptional regulator of autoinduction and epiphytic fitness
MRTMAKTEITPRIDGRAARTQRTRAAVAAALLELLDEGVVEPSAAQIARRAKVSERLVFHHFADLEALYASAAELQMSRILPLIQPVDPTRPFAERLPEFVAARARFFEMISPARRAAIRREPVSPQLTSGLKTAHQMSRNLALSAFSRELAMLPPAESAAVSFALSSAASWETWEYLRRREVLSIARSCRVVQRMIRALFDKKLPNSR